MKFDEQTQFLYEHEARIREWADLLWNADEALTSTMQQTVVRDLRAFAGDHDLVVEEWVTKHVQTVLLARRGWPRRPKVDEPALCIGWELNLDDSSTVERPPFAGVRVVRGEVSDASYRSLIARHMSEYMGVDGWWVHWRYIPARERWFEDPQTWINEQVSTTKQAWDDLAPLIDVVIGISEDGAAERGALVEGDAGTAQDS